MSQNNWQILPQPTEKTVRQLTTKLNIDPLTATVVAQKGFITPESAFQYLQPSIDQLHDPMLLHDMDKAFERLTEAAFGGEKIVVYGDYDLDGMTSTAVMVEALEVLGADVTAYIPNRFKDGYGPNIDVYKRLITEGAQIIVTVDNGVSGHEAVAYAMSQGVDVIITDHHEMPPSLPEAYAIVHPRHPDGHYPFDDLSGVGVAFKVAQALLTDGQSITDKSELPTEMLDLVALGEIADMVSLTDENRTLVSWGLKQINDNPRPGLVALLKNAGQMANQPIISETVSFKIAPRLNAVGRLGDAQLALDLLLSQDSDEAIEIASQVEAINAQRQEFVEEVFGAAKQIALSDKHANDQVLVVAGENWHQGILGIVASRLVELLHKPVIVLSLIDGIYKGSGRTYNNFDLYTLMGQYRALYDTFGGHASALGLAISPENLSKLREQLAELPTLDVPEISVAVNMMLPVSKMAISVYDGLTLLEPFGTGNAQPTFGVQEPTIEKAVTMGSTNQHLKLTLANQIEAVGFNHPEWTTIVAHPANISFVATLGLNYFRGKKRLQLLLTDVSMPAVVENDAHKKFFGHVYKFIYAHQDLNFAQNLDKIAGQLNITKNDLNIMVQVFIELGFVKVIDGGFVKVMPNAPQKALTTSKTYHKFLANR
ncbi:MULTISPECIES: single-stranded-DNA-specific exonuclease RecJ [Leuconostoc]|uniref:Single-stranded-DNA-specific exonuclease RecJ n=1 Tax=Leuconostoc gelidum subsp. gelidum TaxID=1607839 RepID=A0AB35FX30_LEUGE|nr:MULTISPECIES: single-stranded-DNA-specific exonuclease RecJ [Leuconostoc]MBZ5964350.1 single-stranded-DNA-specific exonuclease RecJ [Leuconostoc gelidum subsp. gelidum]MBZ5975051.1 single-stranded-DNA-specific exonuclease RecJ [Leuconostoc gelidum subsp. gelidum]MBZ5976999.1 single-stranded-DNA-specific exonuclease RecJ [Leuconostoc gelidum subsp. gelidum]MBZ5978054.1 single-stranded-DNA-specific exonuclease RecJ [Leuconostoc gelidum subsp. gelidum]MBZ5999582.1 single-stranded-DNA-specific 